MNVSIFAKNVGQAIKRNAPEIFTALAVSGVVTTSYLTAKAGFETAQLQSGVETYPNDRKERIKEQVKQSWRLYIPAAISGTVTIGCIIASSKTNSKRTAAAVTAYSLTERAFSEYREKVVEQIGKGKEQKIRDEIAQAVVSNNPPSKEVIVLGSGSSLCCELYTRRYFRSDMETLRKAQNDINVLVVHQLYVPLNEFYDMLGLTHTSESGNVGWDSDKLMELKFTSVISENGEPCLAFDYNYLKPL